MNIRRGLVIGFSSSLVCIGLLFLVYPWSIYYGNFDFGRGITLVSYLLLAISIGAIEAAVICLLSLCKEMPAAGQCILTGIVSFTALFAVSIFLGPGGTDLFHTRVGGIFFSEWKFVTFDFEVALPISTLNAGLVWCAVRWRHQKLSDVTKMFGKKV